MKTPSSEENITLGPGDALIIVDVQKDFISGGSLAVPLGDEVVPVLNAYIDLFQKQHLPVFATRDWHPADHCSFKEQGGIWPVHCVAESEGARFADDLHLPASAEIVSKDTRPDQDTYSGFEGGDLGPRLQSANVKRVFIGGLATDYCVLHTAKGAVQHRLQVILLEDAVRAVNLKPHDGLKAIDEMVAMGCRLRTLDKHHSRTFNSGALMTDMYPLTMMQGYFDQGMNETAVFEFFVRQLPCNRGFLVSAGLEQVLEYLETLKFTPRELDWLKGCGHFRGDFVDSLAGFRFTGDVDAMPEGTVFFADEPLIRITAPLPQAQLIETRIINLLQFPTLVATKASRMRLAAPGKILIDFGFRRAHGSEAGLLAARASYLAGFAGTATVSAGAAWGIPIFGTMAHSFVQAFADETAAFESFARSHPENVILLLDTYNTERAAHKVVDLSRRLQADGIRIKGVRIDSGDLTRHARAVRSILDAGGLQSVKIFASSGLDETALQKFTEDRAPIDGFGIGTCLATSDDVPFLNCAYKLQEYAGRPCRKLSEGKSTWPGRKQVYRRLDENGKMAADIIALADEPAPAAGPLIQPFMREGKRIQSPTSLETCRQHTANELARLPDSLGTLKETPVYPVTLTQALRDLACSLDDARGN